MVVRRERIETRQKARGTTRPSSETVDHRLTAGDLHAPPFFIFILPVRLTGTVRRSSDFFLKSSELALSARQRFTLPYFLAGPPPRGNRAGRYFSSFNFRRCFASFPASLFFFLLLFLGKSWISSFFLIPPRSFTSHSTPNYIFPTLKPLFSLHETRSESHRYV